MARRERRKQATAPPLPPRGPLPSGWSPSVEVDHIGRVILVATTGRGEAEAYQRVAVGICLGPCPTIADVRSAWLATLARAYSAGARPWRPREARAR